MREREEAENQPKSKPTKTSGQENPGQSPVFDAIDLTGISIPVQSVALFEKAKAAIRATTEDPIPGVVDLAGRGVFLNIGKKLGLQYRTKTDADLAALVENQLPTSIIPALLKCGVLEKEIYSVVLPRRTLQHRRARKAKLSREESDRAVRLARIVALAEQVFGHRDEAMHWLRTPKKRFRGRTPMEMITTETGSRLVEEVLYQIDEGMAA